VQAVTFFIFMITRIRIECKPKELAELQKLKFRWDVVFVFILAGSLFCLEYLKLREQRRSNLLKEDDANSLHHGSI
jgi:hypothetical protein